MTQTDNATFTRRTLRAVDKPVFRLGLACNYGIDAAGVEAALDHGVNYLFWTRMRTGRVAPTVRKALAARREQLVLAGGPSMAYFRGGVRRGAERVLRTLGTDYVDVFHLFWVGTTAALNEGTLDELVRLKEERKVRALAVSIHDRERAGRLAEDSPLDLLMVRYNAAHPGAERDIFPHLARRRPSVVAYTATCWRKLLKPTRRWTGPVMTAGDCYRFCLSNPSVDVVLSGPSSRAELTENLAALEKGPLSADEERWMRDFGRVVHG